MNFGYLILIIVILTVSCVGMCLKYEKSLRRQYFKDEEEEVGQSNQQLGREEIKEELKKKEIRERKAKKAAPIDDVWVLICGFLGGSLGLLIGYLVFPMIRKEDRFLNYRWLIVTIITNVLYLTLVILLCVFKVIKF